MDVVPGTTSNSPSLANHAKHQCIDNAAAKGVDLLVAVPDNAGDASRQSSQPVLDWRARMEIDDAQRLIALAPAWSS